MRLRVFHKRHARRVNGRYRMFWPGAMFTGTARELRAFRDRLWYVPDDIEDASTSPEVPPLEPVIPAGVNPEKIPEGETVETVNPVYDEPAPEGPGNEPGEVVDAVTESDVDLALPLLNELTTPQLEAVVEVETRTPVVKKATGLLGQ